jgi:ABC-type Na+ efflux pump permease subunit
MFIGHINYIAVIIAAIVAWIFSAVWYRVFLTRWLDAVGKTREQLLPGGRRGLHIMAISFLAQLLMAGVVAYFIPVMGRVSVLAGLLTAGLCWLGFVLTSIVINNGYARDRPALAVVASWHWLGVLLVMGGVIGAFG